MKPRLYLHLGPPKTATTSLQIALEEAGSEWLHYGGVFQPRERNAGSLSQRLHQAAAGKWADDNPNISSVLDEIQSHLAAGRSVMISEEMFLVEQRGCPITLKIERLGQFISGTPTTVLLGLRNPVDGIPSLYQEIFRSLPFREQLSFARFCRGPRARCFDYGFLRKTLGENGFRDIRILDFEAITTGTLDLSELIGWHPPTQDALRIGRANMSNKSGAERVMPGVSLKAVGSVRAVRALIDWTGLRSSGVYRKAVDALDRLVLRPPGSRDLRVPDDLASRLRSDYLVARQELQKAEQSG